MIPEEYYIDGGTLDPNSPSYVKRPADGELPQIVLAGKFCYVLTARQMGKSSLAVRTIRQLRADGVRAALVDLTVIGADEISIDQWYLGILTTIVRELQMKSDVLAFWEQQRYLGPPQRFSQFLQDIVLPQVGGQVAIFIDEIDSTLKLTFGDDFFRAIRAIYNSRANNPVYNRLTFVLLGVATPTDLIKDQTGTPFNIGVSITLQEFSYADAAPLRRGLDRHYPGQGDRILRRIFHWTNGHPYLTQHLCRAAVAAKHTKWGDQEVDTLVARSFFADEARRNDNLTFVRDRIRGMADEKRQAMLLLYRRIYAGEAIAEDNRDEPQLYLKLWGLVRIDQGALKPANFIYQRVFDDAWARGLLGSSKTEPLRSESLDLPPTNTRWYLWAGLGVLAVLAVVGWLLLR